MVCALLVLALFATLAGKSAGEKAVFVVCEATVGTWTVEVHPSWSPNGAKRYLDLVEDKFFDNAPLFRAVPGFLVQFGISLDPEKNSKWQANIQDDPYPIQVRACQRMAPCTIPAWRHAGQQRLERHEAVAPSCSVVERAAYHIRVRGAPHAFVC
jgi:hypothetical protein